MAARKRVNEERGKVSTAAARRGKHPKLGQTFLADPGAAQRIVDALGDLSHATVLEIGPGRGVLTHLLAARAHRLIAIEIDRVMAAQLRLKYLPSPHVEVLEGDILAMDLANILGSRPDALGRVMPKPPERKAQVIGNIPYYITSDILLRLFAYPEYIQNAVIMVQKEVADRLAAHPGTSEYGLLSATAQLYTRVEKLFTLPPGAFTPPPKVHSTVLRLTFAPRLQELRVSNGDFIAYLKLSFSQKRKTLLNNLKANYPEALIRRALEHAGVRPDIRAEALSLEKAASVFHNLAMQTGG